MAKQRVSVVSSVYNEAPVLEEFVRRILQAAQTVSAYDFEIILVNDGSTDNSLSVMKNLTVSTPTLRVIDLRRNYGQTPALQAGLDHAQGDIIITLDADLQHAPEEIPLFLSKIEEGYDMVCGWRHQRAEGPIRRWPSGVANQFLKWISGLPIHDFGTTFRGYRAEIIRDIRLFGEFHRFIPILGRMVGATITEVPIQNIVRPQGQSHYGLTRTVGVSIDMVLLVFLIRYLDRPMRIFGKIALVCLIPGVLILAILVYMAYSRNIHAVEEHIGWFLASIMLILSSLQILLAGILAELLMRVHFSQSDRRTYHVRGTWPR
jgi:glycosyltransferase involved in cell wall biosynthesis